MRTCKVIAVRNACSAMTENAPPPVSLRAFRVFSPQGCHRIVFMSELDVAKEKIAYLKVWLGILLVTDISTFGWLVSNVDTATPLLLWAAVVVRSEEHTSELQSHHDLVCR